MFGEKRTPLVRSELIKVRNKALRKGVWFRVLTRIERACVDLAIIVVERIRSRLLQKVLSSVLNKLEEAVESKVRRLMLEVGEHLASKLSQIAQEWGYKGAARWTKDTGFKQFLTITYMNTPT